MINMIILVVFALIGLVVGYLAISIKLSKAKEQAETTLLKAEQDAVNLRSQAVTSFGMVIPPYSNRVMIP